MTTQTLTVDSKCLEEQGVVVLTVLGSVDSTTYALLETKLDRMIHHGEVRIVIDLAQVDYVTLAGVRVLVTARAKASHEHGDIVLMMLSESVAQVVDLLRIRDILSIARDLPEAVKLLAQCELASPRKCVL